MAILETNVNTLQHELKGKAALDYIVAGHGKATLIGKKNRYTFKFGKLKDPNDKIVFVNLLTGPNNETDYQYIGFVNATHTEMKAGFKGNAAHPAYKAMDWFLKALNSNPRKAEQAIFLHEGVCCRCGRTLTNPESIENGIGPECAKKARK